MLVERGCIYESGRMGPREREEKRTREKEQAIAQKRRVREDLPLYEWLIGPYRQVHYLVLGCEVTRNMLMACVNHIREGE